MNNPGKDILFWSPRCPHSRNLIEQIENSPLRDSIIMFNVHDTEYELPPFVQVVPTVFVKMGKQVLINDELRQWLTQKIQSVTSQPRNDPQMGNPGNNNPGNNNPGNNNPGNNQTKKKPIVMNDDLTGEKTRQDISISDFNPGEMGAGFSDNYSFLENGEAVASHNFNFIGNADDTPPVTTIKTNSENMGEFPTQNTQGNNNISSYNPNQGNPNQGNPNQGNPNQGNNTGYNPDIFADPNYSNASNGSRRADELGKKYEDLMRRRDVNDNLSSMYQ